MLQPLDRDRLREEYLEASPFPFIKIDNFLDPKAAAEIADAYPSFTTAAAQGMAFSAVNEFKKVQITDQALFPAPVARLNKALASSSFLADLSYGLASMTCLPMNFCLAAGCM